MFKQASKAMDIKKNDNGYKARGRKMFTSKAKKPWATLKIA